MSRWLRCSLYLAAGLPDEILLEDALDVVQMALMLRRAVPPSKWITELQERAAMQSLEGLM